MLDMKLIPSIRLAEHRRARITTWARLMLAWIGMMLFAPEPPRAKNGQLRRLIRRRYPQLSLAPMARLVAHLIFMRALAMLRVRRRPRVRDFTGAGFRRRLNPRHVLRAAIGSRVRAGLRHPDLRTRFARIVAAFNEVDAIAARLVRRLRRGLMRRTAIVAVRPPRANVRSVGFATSVAFADTS